MYIEAIVIGAIIGWFGGGSLRTFLNAEFRGRYLALLALFVFAAPYALQLLGAEMEYAVLPYVAMINCVLVAFLNRDIMGMKLLIVGLALNLVIMGMNDFAIPINTNALVELGNTTFVESVRAGEILNYRDMAGAAGLSVLLGKVFALPNWYPMTTVLSVGDILASIAVVLIVQDSMKIHRKGDMLHFSLSPGGIRR